MIKKKAFIILWIIFSTMSLSLVQAYATLGQSKSSPKRNINYVDVKTAHEVFDNAFNGAQSIKTSGLGLSVNDITLPSDYTPFYIWSNKDNGLMIILAGNSDQVMEVMVMDNSRQNLGEYLVESDKYNHLLNTSLTTAEKWSVMPTTSSENAAVSIHNGTLKIYPQGGSVTTKKYVKNGTDGNKYVTAMQSSKHEVLLRSMSRQEFDKAIANAQLTTESSALPKDNSLRLKPFSNISYSPAVTQSQTDFPFYRDLLVNKDASGAIVLMVDPLVGKSLITPGDGGDVILESPMTISHCSNVKLNDQKQIVLADSGTTAAIEIGKASGATPSSHKKITVRSQSSAECVSMSRAEYQDLVKIFGGKIVE